MHRRRWNICDTDDNCLAQLSASSDQHALDLFAISRGYAPYDYENEEKPYYLYGRLHASFENFELMIY